MDITVKKQENISVVSIIGDIVMESNAIFRNRIVEIMEEDDLNIVIDLQDVDYMDSSGIGILLMLFKKLSEQDRTLKLINCSKKVSELIGLTSFRNLLE